MTRGSRLARLLALIVASALVAAACSGDDGGSEPSDQSAPDNTTDTAPVDAPDPEAAYLAGGSDVLFDQTELHTFDLTLPAENLAEIDADPAAEKYVDGTLSFRGETIDPVGIRYKGSIGAFFGCLSGPNPFVPTGEKTCTKLSMKIKIDEAVDGLTFYGVERLQLHAMNLDPTLMHERLGYWLFNEMGVYAPRAVHARVTINGGFAGLFALVEQIDERFLAERYDDPTGNLYKEIWPVGADGLPHDAADYIGALRTNEKDPDVERMLEFGRALFDEGPSSVGDWVDVDVALRNMAVDRTIRHDDGPLHWYCFQGPCAPHNYYWYDNPITGRFELLPWDLDNSFENIGGDANPVTPIADEWGETSNGCEPYPYGALNALQRSAACDPVFAGLVADGRFDRFRDELIAGPFSSAVVDPLLDEWSAQIEGVVTEAAAAHGDAPSVEAWRAALDDFRAALEIARAS